MLFPKLERNKDIARCAWLGTEIRGHCQEQLTQALIVLLLKLHLFYVVPKIGAPWSLLCIMVTRS